VPSVGRPSLRRLLDALEPQREQLGEVFVVDGRAHGPAAARNQGWRESVAEWVAFLDDDVVPGPDWAASLRRDIAALDAGVGGSQGRVRVPLPEGRRPTDWERDVAGLGGALWISADIAFRRAALESVGGFDERFPRAYREDADLALRLTRRGWRIAPGARRVEHPVPAAGFWVSVGRQRGNADDALMRVVHGRHWRRWSGTRRGRLQRHLLASAALTGAGAALVGGRRGAAGLLAAAWLGFSAELAAARIGPGPRDREEVGRMLATSAALPAAASAWWIWGWLRLPALLLHGGPRGDGSGPPQPRPEAILLDRDGTLLLDVPYNGDPAKVVPLPSARRALQRLRLAGLPMAVISNQSGVGRGLLEPEQVEAVNRRAEQLLGPIGPWLCCPHAPGEGCECRKPAPGLVVEAARRLGVSPERCAVIGDIAADVQAAQAAGATAVLVPTAATEREDVRRAPAVAETIEDAVARLLDGGTR
jgi:histidinol-phosphate phosphatase family protein